MTRCHLVLSHVWKRNWAFVTKIQFSNSWVRFFQHQNLQTGTVYNCLNATCCASESEAPVSYVLNRLRGYRGYNKIMRVPMIACARIWKSFDSLQSYFALFETYTVLLSSLIWLCYPANWAPRKILFSGGKFRVPKEVSWCIFPVNRCNSEGKHSLAFLWTVKAAVSLRDVLTSNRSHRHLRWNVTIL